MNRTLAEMFFDGTDSTEPVPYPELIASADACGFTRIGRIGLRVGSLHRCPHQVLLSPDNTTFLEIVDLGPIPQLTLSTVLTNKALIRRW